MSTTTDTSTLDKKVIREMLAGYAVAAEVIERERVERLRQMTPAESRKTYAQLVAFHQQFARGIQEQEQEGLRRLEEWRLQTKLAVRQAFDRIALAQKLS